MQVDSKNQRGAYKVGDTYVMVLAAPKGHAMHPVLQDGGRYHLMCEAVTKQHTILHVVGKPQSKVWHKHDAPRILVDVNTAGDHARRWMISAYEFDNAIGHKRTLSSEALDNYVKRVTTNCGYIAA